MSEKDKNPYRLNLLDRAMLPFAPQAVYKNVQARAALSGLVSYSPTSKGGGTKGTLQNWIVNRLSRFTEGLERETLTNRAEDLVGSDPHAASVVDSMSVNIAGTGLTPQANPYAKLLGWTDDQAKDYQDSAEWAYSVWAKTADARNRLPFWAIQFMSAKTLLTSGEFFRVPIMFNDAQRKAKGRTFSLALQCIDPIRCFTPADFISKTSVRDGIELDELGGPQGYWFANTEKAFMRGSLSSTDMLRLPAAIGHRPGVLHGFVPKRDEDVRGTTILKPAMKFFRDLSDYLDFELVGAIVAASFPVFISPKNPYALPGTFPNLPGAGTQDPAGKVTRYQEVVPGTIMYGNANEEPHILKSDRPGNSFPVFVERILRAVGAAIGMPYEVIAKDFSKTNYSSARAALLEAWRVFSFYQKWLVDQLCQPCWDMALEEAYLRNMLIIPPGSPDFYEQRAAYTRARWIPPRKGHVDPVKEITALIDAIDHNLMTQADGVAELSGDWEDTFTQRGRERSREKKLDIVPPGSAKGKALPPGDDDKTQTTEDSPDGTNREKSS